MAVLANRAGVSTPTLGAGVITLGAPLAAGAPPNAAAWQSFAASGVTDGQVVRYLILDSNGAWEYGLGTYGSAGTTLTRPAGAMDGSVPGQKSSTGALLSLTGTAQVFIAVVAEDIVPLLARDTTANISVGYTITPYNLGNIGSFTLNPALGNYQYGTNVGAATWTAPTVDCAIDVLVTNSGSGSAGSITFSGFTVGFAGDVLTAGAGNRYMISIRRINAVATYAIKALQ